jgi:hypothetical protein
VFDDFDRHSLPTRFRDDLIHDVLVDDYFFPSLNPTDIFANRVYVQHV